jgi:hypothetical protein
MPNKLHREEDGIVYFNKEEAIACHTISADSSKDVRKDLERLFRLAAMCDPTMDGSASSADRQRKGAIGATYREGRDEARTPEYLRDEVEADEDSDKERLDRFHPHSSRLYGKDNVATAEEPSASQDRYQSSKEGQPQTKESILEELERCRAELAELKGTRNTSPSMRHQIIHSVTYGNGHVKHWLDHP